MENSLNKSFVEKASPLRMPVQDLTKPSRATETVLHSLPLSVVLWRVIMLLFTGALTAYFATELYAVLSLNGITNVQTAFLVLSVISFIGISIGASASLCGFIGLSAKMSSTTLTLVEKPQRLMSRTALLFPIYHEDPDEIALAIRDISHDLEQSGVNRNFAVYILSDSRDRAKRRSEAEVFAQLRHELTGIVPVYFRWREDNRGKKAGNIKDWVVKQGGAFEHFVIFDADSVMSADTLIGLAGTMESYPRAGLLQTVPKLVSGTTLMALIQQFSSWTYGPLLAFGNALWMGRDSNYWGHNAIIRTKAFAASAGLPELRGTPPFGGAIHSHDFVEAALLRKAGWEVHLIPELDGSYEECPPSIVDCLIRDRRWCQGNLQHSRLLNASGLTLVSRFHLLSGIMSYVASIMWAFSLMAGLVTAYQSLNHEHQYFSDEISLFPNWPVMDAERAFSLLIFTGIVLLTPKFLGLFYALFFDKRWSSAMSKLGLVGGYVIELAFSAIMAPIFMLSHVGAIVSIVIGRDSGWGTQKRGAAGDQTLPVLLQFIPHMIVGLLLLAFCSTVSSDLVLWLSLVYSGLILSPLLVWVSAKEPGRFLSFCLATPDKNITQTKMFTVRDEGGAERVGSQEVSGAVR